MPEASRYPKSPRADARRNRGALLAAGEKLFALHGLAMPFEDVARVAGVGKGTLYRHFATRDHLLAALMQERFDRLAAEADILFKTTEPLRALVEWLRAFDRYPTRSRSLGSRVGVGLADENSAVSRACLPMKQAFVRLLVRAQDEGAVRADIDAAELLTVVASLPEQYRRDDGSSGFLDVILSGLRTGSSVR